MAATAPPTKFTVDRFVLTTGKGEDAMKARANRYRPPTHPERRPDEAGYIMLLAHGSGFRTS